MLHPPLTIGDWIRLGALAVLRILPIVSLTPLFGGTLIPARLRLAYGVFFGMAFVPGLALGGPVASDWVGFFLLSVRETLIGGFVAIVIRLMFDSYAAAGGIVDFLRGASNSSIIDPYTKHEESHLAVFLSHGAVVLFMLAGGHALLFEAWAAGYVRLPLGGDSAMVIVNEQIAPSAITLCGVLMSVAVRLTAPVLVVTLLIDCAMGIINRAATQIPVTQLAPSLKGVAAFAMLGAVLLTNFADPMHQFVRVLQAFLGHEGAR